jgi:hypothetical protein
LGSSATASATLSASQRLKVVSISAKNGQIILKMEHADLMPKINWNGEESVDFF